MRTNFNAKIVEFIFKENLKPDRNISASATVNNDQLFFVSELEDICMLIPVISDNLLSLESFIFSL